MLRARRSMPHAPARLLVPAFAAALIGVLPLNAAADAAPDATSATVDTLWAQPEGMAPDNPLYVVQSWWDGVARSREQDATLRGLEELQQANTDLLDVYSLLLRQQTDPGPHPLGGIDPLLSNLWNIITGSHPRAPLGSVLAWVGGQMLRAEGRGSTQALVQTLLKDFDAEQSAADRDLAGGSQALWSANSDRQHAMLLKIQDLVSSADELSPIVAQVDHSRKAAAAEHKAASSDHGKGGQNDHDAGKGQPMGAGSAPAHGSGRGSGTP